MCAYNLLSPYSAKPKCTKAVACVLDQGFDKFNHFLEASLPDPSTAAARSVKLESCSKEKWQVQDFHTKS